jgi:hypothetical protein
MGKFKAGDKVRFLKHSFDEDYFEIGEVLTVSGEKKTNGIDSFYSTKDDTPFIFVDQVELVEASENSNVPKKYNDNKPMMSLIRPEFTKALAEALSYGAVKYQEEKGDTPNYLKGGGFLYSDIIDSLERHLNSFKTGINLDEESGLEHIIQVAVNAMFLHSYRVSGLGKDDRFSLKSLDDK